MDRENQNAIWLIFRYNKLPYVAEVAIKEIYPGKEILTYYGSRYRKMRIEMKDAETFINNLLISDESKDKLLKLHQKIKDDSSCLCRNGCKSEGDVQKKLQSTVSSLDTESVEILADLYYDYSLKEESKPSQKAAEKEQKYSTKRKRVNDENNMVNAKKDSYKNSETTAESKYNSDLDIPQIRKENKIGERQRKYTKTEFFQWTEVLNNKLLDLKSKGCTMQEISSEIGCTYDQASNRYYRYILPCKKLNTKTEFFQWTDKLHEKMLDLKNKGYSWKNISDEIGCTLDQARNRYQRHILHSKK
jgi:hypothetical protein